jgi:iron(II)-dependent oxidoreductase
MSAPAPPFDRTRLVDRYLAQRRRSRAFFDRIEAAGAYSDRPIPLRNPFVFYEGHLPAFSVNTLLKRGLGRRGLNEHYEKLFERGIDPESEAKIPPGQSLWPSRKEVLAYAEAADEAVVAALSRAELERTDVPALAGGQAIFTILEHEPMHQETLGYMAHRLEPSLKARPEGYRIEIGAAPPEPRAVRIPEGRVRLGADQGRLRFGWDNEFPELTVDVPAFTIDVFDVTNRDFMEFVRAGGYARRDLWSEEGWAFRENGGLTHPLFWERDGEGGWLWRGMFQRLPLPPAWPVWVSGEEAAAYARWKGRRLPTEAEIHRAAYGTPEGIERSYPWGEEWPDATRGCFGFESWEPVPVGSRPAGASAFGVMDLLGNGWEWSSTPFAGFPGFVPMASYPVYSTDFFDGKHWVIKGGSPATAHELLRRSFRNWFRPNYPYVYAAFRCVST